jgi:hypothetical protein
MVIEKESSPDALEQKANNKLYPRALKKGLENKIKDDISNYYMI